LTCKAVLADVKLPARHICLVILLGMLIGHTSIAVHAAAHVTGDVGECEFCIAYGDSADAIEAAQACGGPDGGAQLLSDILVGSPVTKYVLPFRPRGPPSID